MAAKLPSLWVDAHNRGPREDQFWFPWQKNELHNHSPPCGYFIWTSLYSKSVKRRKLKKKNQLQFSAFFKCASIL